MPYNDNGQLAFDEKRNGEKSIDSPSRTYMKSLMEHSNYGSSPNKKGKTVTSKKNNN